MWIHSGRIVDPMHLAEYMHRVTLSDVSWALAHTYRWGGHADPAISVAQHAAACARAAMANPRLALVALHHDDGEAFFGDMVRGIKEHPSMAEYRRLEHEATELCIRRFAPACAGIPVSAVKELDTRSLLWERARLLPPDRDSTDYHPELFPLPDECFVIDQSPAEAARSWLELHETLTGACT